MDKDKLFFKSQVRRTKPVSGMYHSQSVICNSSWRLWVQLGCQSLAYDKGHGLPVLPCCRKLELPRAPAWGMLHQCSVFLNQQPPAHTGPGVDSPQPQHWTLHIRVSRLAQRQLPLILLFPGFRSGLTSAALASTGDLPTGLEAALRAWARYGPGPAQRQGHKDLRLVLLFCSHACIQPHTHAHAILLALL